MQIVFKIQKRAEIKEMTLRFMQKLLYKSKSSLQN